MTQIVNYSEKAIAVIGDTKVIKDQLKALGGRFNPRLNCGAGWIFSAKKRAEVEALLGKGEKPAASNIPADWKIYVGTYAKYNNGSLEGKWLHLCDYASKADFYKACRELHKDEADPEFMFQDASGVPSWMWGESSVSDEIWQYKPEKEQKGAQSTAEKVAILQKYVKLGSYMEYERRAKENYLVVEVEGRCFEIDKPGINTRFCHPDEPADEVAAWWKVCRTYPYFESENALPRAEIVNDPEAYILKDWHGLHYLERPIYGRRDENAIELTDTTRKALVAAYKKAGEMHKKRLQTWWKRYGADKLHCWTYWAEA